MKYAIRCAALGLMAIALAGSFLSGAASNPQLSSLLGNVDMDVALKDSFNSVLGSSGVSSALQQRTAN